MTSSSETAVVVALSAAYGGAVLARRDGRVVFVRGAVPGERVLIRITEKKAWYDTAEVIGVEEASPLRVEPSCNYVGSCGGCQLQYLSHAGQLALKSDVLGDCLMRIGGVEVSAAPPLYDPEPWGYRVRGQFKVAAAEIGFFREKSRCLVDIAACPLMADEVNEGLRLIRKVLARRTGAALEEQFVYEAHITCGDVPVVLLKTRPGAAAPAIRRVARQLIEAGVAGVTVQPQHANVVSEGVPCTTFKLCGLSYSVSPRSFLQSHWRLNQFVAEFLKKELHPLGGKRVVDLYAGAGNFSLPLCDDACEVVCVEADPWAVGDGKRNVALNKKDNCRFVHSEAEEVRPGGRVDILILDPPRTGLSGKVIERIRALRADKIVYISCNPSTFARDLKKLLLTYRIESVRTIDFFPQTYHIEAVAILEMR